MLHRHSQDGDLRWDLKIRLILVLHANAMRYENTKREEA